MIQRDYILRQVQQLAQVLAQVLFHKRAAQTVEAEQALTEGLEEALGMNLEDVRGLSRQELLALCRPGRTLAGEMSVAVADLLREDEVAAGRERARWLYEAALANRAVVPFDVHDRIEALRTPPS
ncbi:MAG: hypothetical protein AAGI71_13790 [Bacteroidota bacterium]